MHYEVRNAVLQITRCQFCEYSRGDIPNDDQNWIIRASFKYTRVSERERERSTKPRARARERIGGALWTTLIGTNRISTVLGTTSTELHTYKCKRGRFSSNGYYIYQMISFGPLAVISFNYTEYSSLIWWY